MALNDYFKVLRISVPYRDVVEIKRGTVFLMVVYKLRTGSGGIKTRKVKLPFLEMRADDRTKCLDILRQRAPDAFKSVITKLETDPAAHRQQRDVRERRNAPGSHSMTHKSAAQARLGGPGTSGRREVRVAKVAGSTGL